MIIAPPPLDSIWCRFAFGFVMGAILGSFSTMLAYRLPRHISIVFPRSHCPTCETTLGIKDLVPIFSYLTSRGHCRHCHSEIGVEYLATEIFASLACAFLTILTGYGLAMIFAYIAVIALIVAVTFAL